MEIINKKIDWGNNRVEYELLGTNFKEFTQMINLYKNGEIRKDIGKIENGDILNYYDIIDIEMKQRREANALLLFYIEITGEFPNWSDLTIQTNYPEDTRVDYTLLSNIINNEIEIYERSLIVAELAENHRLNIIVTQELYNNTRLYIPEEYIDEEIEEIEARYLDDVLLKIPFEYRKNTEKIEGMLVIENEVVEMIPKEYRKAYYRDIYYGKRG